MFHCMPSPVKWVQQVAYSRQRQYCKITTCYFADCRLANSSNRLFEHYSYSPWAKNHCYWKTLHRSNKLFRGHVIKRTHCLYSKSLFNIREVL